MYFDKFMKKFIGLKAFFFPFPFNKFYSQVDQIEEEFIKRVFNSYHIMILIGQWVTWTCPHIRSLVKLMLIFFSPANQSLTNPSLMTPYLLFVVYFKSRT